MASCWYFFDCASVWKRKSSVKHSSIILTDSFFEHSFNVVCIIENTSPSNSPSNIMKECIFVSEPSVSSFCAQLLSTCIPSICTCTLVLRREP
uniref:Uncharacterized protein n=1 Tax=Arundo donax TaxID=35708 RepID=A0A0A9DXK4_ARUDO